VAPQPGTRLYVEVDDLEETLRRAEALGGAVERRRTALGGDDRWFAVVTDPSGVSFGMWTEHELVVSGS
jgi:predicted enzyme related to lactoylglutathione lyase